MNESSRTPDQVWYSWLTWPTASLRTYLLVMILLAILPFSALIIYQIYDRVISEQDRRRESTQRIASLLAQSINRELESTRDALQILSFSETLQGGQVNLFERSLRVNPRTRPSWHGIYLLSENGNMIFDTTLDEAGDHPTGRNIPGLLERLVAQQVVVSAMMGDGERNSFETRVEVPVTVPGEPAYILGTHIPITIWQQLVEKSGVDVVGGVVALWDSNHRLMARNKTPERYVGTRQLASNQAQIDASPSGSARLNMFEGGYSYAAWETVPLSNWIVVVGMPAAPIDGANQQAFVIALGTTTGCLLLGTFLALFAARKILHPLQQLSQKEITPLVEPIAVREIALLRTVLLDAQQQNQAARDRLLYKSNLLQKRATEFEALFLSSPIGLVFAEDPLCRVITHNAAMNQLLGSTGSQSENLLRFIENGRPLSPEDQPLQRAAAYGETTQDREMELLVEGSPPIVVIVNAVPLIDIEGQPRGAISAVIDITARKAAEERLRSTEKRLRESQRLVDLAQEVGHVGFFHYEFDADLFTWSPGLAKLFALVDGEGSAALAEWAKRIGRKNWHSILYQLCRGFRQRHETETLNYCVQIAEGNTRWLSSRVHINYRHDGEPQFLIGITVDMTEQKKSESERSALITREQAARLDAEAANRSKDVFLAMLGHELRNPLSAMTAAIEVLNRVGGPSETEISARRILNRQTHLLARMMDDLLDVSRVVSGQVKLTRHSFDLAARVQRIIETLTITGQLEQHELKLDFQEVWVDADPTRLEQIVNNLVINAIKYTPPGGRIKVSVYPDHGAALLEVRNAGNGISPDLLPRIFDLFIQGDRSLDRRNGGLGIGLSLVRRLVDLHGGSISAENTHPGTLMRVRLPAIDTPVNKLQTVSLPKSRCRSVAIIDDNEDVLHGMRSLLEIDGHTVWTASDGISGLALVLHIRPDLALVDIGLPGLSGFEVAKRSRAGGYAGRMVALTGYGQDSDVKQGLAAGFDAYILKPIDGQKLRDLLGEE